MESQLDYHQAKALLEWQIDLGATEAIGEHPVNRYEEPAQKPRAKPKTAPEAPRAPLQIDSAAVSRQMADGAADLDALRAALGAYEHCELKNGARSLVFSDGKPGARVMIIGEAPGRDEDREGRPFVGRAGQLLDAMLAAIDHGRDHAENPVYITNVMPWRPPNNREPTPDEIAMMLPFLERHVALAQPDMLVLMGNVSCLAVLGKKGITKLRGGWVEAFGKPAIPMFHPAYLLRNPPAKREAWLDLLSLQKKVRA
ncbi:MAG: uracil-DNA glycosylase [Pseudomonadota bacterium]